MHQAGDRAVLAVRHRLRQAEAAPRRGAALTALRRDAAAIAIVLIAEGPPQKRFLAPDRRGQRRRPDRRAISTRDQHAAATRSPARRPSPTSRRRADARTSDTAPTTVTSRDLLQVPGGPDAQRFAARRDRRRRRASDRPVGCASHQHEHAERRSRAARAAARGVAISMPTPASGTRRVRRQPPLDRVEHFVDLDVEQAHPLEPAAAQVVALADGVARHGHVVAATTARCAPAASDRRCRRSACRRAAAMCVGPVSPDTITAAPRASATTSAIVVCGDSDRGAAGRGDDRRRRAPPRRAPRGRPTSARAARAARAPAPQAAPAATACSATPRRDSAARSGRRSARASRARRVRVDRVDRKLRRAAARCRAARAGRG